MEDMSDSNKNGRKTGLFRDKHAKYALIASSALACLSVFIHVTPVVSSKYQSSKYKAAQSVYEASRDNGDYKLAAHNFEILIAKFKEMSTHDVDSSYFQKVQAFNYDQLGELHYLAKDYRKSEAAYATSLEHYKALAKMEGETDLRYQYPIVKVYSYMARAASDGKNYHAVHTYTAHAKPYLDEIMKDETYRPEGFLLNYSLSFYRGNAFRMQHDFDNALTTHQLGIDSVQKLIELKPDILKYQDYLGIAYRELGRDYAAMNNTNAARENFEQAIRLSEAAALKSQNPYHYERSLMSAHYNLAMLSGFDEDEQYQKAFDILKRHKRINRLHNHDVYEFNYLRNRFGNQTADGNSVSKLLRHG